MDPTSSQDALVQAVVQGAIMAFTFSGILFAAIGVIAALATAGYFNYRIAKMEEGLLEKVVGDAERRLRKITANARNRMGYFEWSVAQLSTLSPEERGIALRTAVSDVEAAYKEMLEVGVQDNRDAYLMLTIRNNLAWYYAEANTPGKATEAKDHARYVADQNWRFRDPEWFKTKAFVLTAFANTCAEAREALQTYELLRIQYGDDPSVMEAIAERRPRSEQKIRELCGE